jgi:hypothetical protein
VRRVKEEVDRLGLTTKVRHGVDQRMRGGRPLSRGHIYHLLSNPLYVGRITHHGESFEGQHPAIIEPETWDAVQKRLAAQTPARPPRVSVACSSPLRGKLFDEAGALLTPSHTVKSGRRYRYYVSRISSQRAESAPSALMRSARWRLPAHEIERTIRDAVAALFENRAALARVARESGVEKARVSDLLEAAQSWTGKPLGLVQRVDLSAEKTKVHLDLSGFLRDSETVVRFTIPLRMRRRGVEMRLVIDGEKRSSGEVPADPALIKAVARAGNWFEQLSSGRAESLSDIAEAEGVTGRYVGHVVPLAFLAPDIVARILDGTQPVELTAEKLTKRVDLPMSWADQRALLGFGT